MNRRKPVASSAPPVRPEPIPLPALLERALVGALVALVVARTLVAGDDPGRLRLTSGGGPISFNLCVFLVFLGTIAWRIAYGRGRADRWAVVIPLLLAGIALVAYMSSRLDGRYARPGHFVAWEWGAIAAAVYLTRRLVPSVADSRGLLNVFLATAVSVAGLGLYQGLSDRLGLPTIDIVIPRDVSVLAGDDEFYPELNHPPATARSPRGTFDSPATLVVFLFLLLPAAIAVSRGRDGSRYRRWVVAIPVVLVGGAVAAILARPFEVSVESWSAAIRLIAEQPLLGVGPGNFSRFAPEVLTPHSAWLGLAATTGLIGLGLFVTAIVLAIRAAWPTGVPDVMEPPVRGTRWEFYLGGTAGLLLGFVWSTGEMPAEAPPGEVFKLGAAAILRAVLWFSAFALLETVRGSPRDLARTILLGVGLVVAFGFVSDAPGLPTILFPMGVMLALAINFRRPAGEDRLIGSWTRPVLVTAAIATTGLVVAYLVTAALPAWATATGVREARMASRHFPERHRRYEVAPPGPEKANAVTAARGYLIGSIINPLAEAADRDPTNAALWLELARWRRPLWQYQLVLDPADAIRVADNSRKMAEERAGKLDPKNPAWKRSLFESFLLYRGSSTALQSERVVALNKLVSEIAEREPQSEVSLRYRIVRMLLDRGEPAAVEVEVTTLLRLNRADGSPHGRLTDEQKADVVDRARKLLPKLSQERLEEWSR